MTPAICELTPPTVTMVINPAVMATDLCSMTTDATEVCLVVSNEIHREGIDLAPKHDENHEVAKQASMDSEDEPLLSCHETSNQNSESDIEFNPAASTTNPSDEEMIVNEIESKIEMSKNLINLSTNSPVDEPKDYFSPLVNEVQYPAPIYSLDYLPENALTENFPSEKWRTRSKILRNERVRKVAVALSLMAIAQAIFSVGMINSGFLGVHLEGRKISGTVYGLIGSAAGMGYMIAPVFNLFGRLHHQRGVPIHSVLIGILVVALLKSLGHGLCNLIPDNTIYSAVAVIMSLLSGAASYTGSMALVEGVRVWFPLNFQIVSSLVTGTAAYVGYGMFSFIGTVSYKAYGFQAPYLALAIFILIVIILALMVLPRDSQPISSFHRLNKKSSSSETSSEASTEGGDRLSFTALLPSIGQFLITMAGGFSIISSVPFLAECCGVSVETASTIISAKSLSTAIGFIVAGLISERRLLTPNTQSILGSILVLSGILLLFPPSSLTPLYSNSLYSGYLAISLIGIGDSLVITVTIRNMEDVQGQLCYRNLTPQNKSAITSCWLIAWVAGETAGKFLSGFFLEIMDFHQGAWSIGAAGLVGCAIFGVLRMVFVVRERRNGKSGHGLLLGNAMNA